MPFGFATRLARLSHERAMEMARRIVSFLPSANEVTRLLNALPSKPQVLWLTPKCLEQIFNNFRELGEEAGRLQRAEDVIAASHARLENIAAATRQISSRPRVFCMEWLDPV